MSQKSIREVALRLLTGRDYSRNEIVRKLKSKGYPLEEIETLLIEFTQNNLIDDPRFTENYIHKQRNKGYGPRRIHLQLQALGLSAELIAEKLEINDNVWLAEIRKVWQKHFKGKQADNFKDHAKQMRFLLYRGFTTEQIESVLDKLNR
ncbi:MAG: hypothetical protein A3F11_06160 [Gammaproteobacteria bacterium RIFCSPHIGHO2_12_FULL_37_14]|nr:MAG: hypothetical protein A3F11_06160 [Gammaproteobacteria bacterium RIFCSPHIGHO2_12_FULL_37_14]